MKTNNHFGAYLSLTAFYKLSQKIDLKFSIESNLLLASQIKNGVQYYYSHYYKVNDEVTLNEENDEKVSISDKEYFNFNSLNFSLGLRYYFGLTKANPTNN